MAELKDLVYRHYSCPSTSFPERIVKVNVCTHKDIVEHVIKGANVTHFKQVTKKVTKRVEEVPKVRERTYNVGNIFTDDLEIQDTTANYDEAKIPPIGKQLIKSTDVSVVNGITSRPDASKNDIYKQPLLDDIGLSQEFEGQALFEGRSRFYEMITGLAPPPKTPGFPLMVPSAKELARAKQQAQSNVAASSDQDTSRVKISDVLKSKNLPHISNLKDYAHVLDVNSQSSAHGAASSLVKRKCDSQHPDGEEEQCGAAASRDRYFTDHQQGARGASKTSNSRLPDDVALALADRRLVMEAAADGDAVLREERQALIHGYRQHYRRWMLHFCEGRNVCLYGVGSKRCVMQDFIETYLHGKYTYINVQAYNQRTVNIKEILSCVCEALGISQVSLHKYNTDCVDEIDAQVQKAAAAAGGREELFLVIHNIDSEQLRSERVQTILSQLAHLQYIHVIATIDHIHAPTMWSDMHLYRYQWYWYHVPTYESHDEEVKYERSACDSLNLHSHMLALSSLTHVFASLPVNAKKIFLLLLTYHFEHQEGADYTGMPFNVCYRLCREQFLVNSQMTLRQQFTEFKDHKLIKIRKCPDSSEIIQLLVDDGILREFNEQVVTDDLY